MRLRVAPTTHLNKSASRPEIYYYRSAVDKLSMVMIINIKNKTFTTDRLRHHANKMVVPTEYKTTNEGMFTFFKEHGING